MKWIAATTCALAVGCLSEPPYSCTITSQGDTPGARIGTMGGLDQGIVDCAADELVVGLSVMMTLQPSDLGVTENAVVTAQLRCAKLTDDGGQTSTQGVHDVAVAQGTIATLQGPYAADCPDGAAIIGFTAHVVDQSVGRLFDSIALECAHLDVHGAPTSMTSVPIAGTGSTAAETTAACAAPGLVHGMRPYVGDGFDQFIIQCAAAACTR
jgi:hypothetical protein